MSSQPRDKPKRAKVFWSGRSQAVRLPKAFRFKGREVSIYRDGNAVVLEPIRKSAWPSGYWTSFGPLGDDFQPPEQLPSSEHRDEPLRDL